MNRLTKPPGGYDLSARQFYLKENFMRVGILVTQIESGRLDVCFQNNEYYGGLHCGQTMDVKINQKWIPTRIEMDEDWYLVGVDTGNIVGLTVRI